jgi:hypothetical protein
MPQTPTWDGTHPCAPWYYPAKPFAVDSLLNLNFLTSHDTVRLKYHQKQLSKNNNDNGQKNNNVVDEGVGPRARGRSHATMLR